MAARVAKHQKYSIASWLCLRTRLETWVLGLFFSVDWCVEVWPPDWTAKGFCSNLTRLELFVVVVAVEIWGDVLRNRHVCFWSDNLRVASCINNLTSSSLPIRSLLCHFMSRFLDYNIWFRSWQVLGVENTVADALSNSRWQ